jgi:photosystem II stability/assembly factor-like uncharacterized protein
MKNIILCLLALVFISTSMDAQIKFEKINAPHDFMINDVSKAPDGTFWSASYAMYRSDDNCDSWKSYSVLDFNGKEYDLENNPKQIFTIFSDSKGNAYVTMDDYYIYKTTDKGLSWNILIDSPDDVNSMHEDKNGRIYAYDGRSLNYTDDYGETWKADTVLLNSGNTRIFKKMGVSPEGDIFISAYDSIAVLRYGATEYQIYKEGLEGKNILCFDFANDTIYAGTREDGLLYSIDAGESWKNVASIPDSTEIGVVRVLPNGNILVSLQPTGLLESSDNGVSWSRVELFEKEKINSIKIIDNGIYICSYGLYISEDNGKTWINKNDGLGFGLIQSFSLDHSGNYFGLTVKDAYKSDTTFQYWEPLNIPEPGEEVNEFFVDRDGNYHVYMGSYDPYYVSKDGGVIWDEVVIQEGEDLDDIKLLKSGDILAFYNYADNNLMISNDNGGSWSTIYTESSYNLFIGEDDEIILHDNDELEISFDYGKSWSDKIDLDKLGDLASYRYSLILKDSTIIIKSWDNTFDEDKVFCSNNMGQTWTDISYQIINKEPKLNVSEFSWIDGVFYYITSTQIFSSDDNGVTWNEFSFELDEQAILDYFALPDRYIYVSTLKGFYRSTEAVVGVDEELVLDDNSYMIYPNPVAGNSANLKINSMLAGTVRVSVYDVKGNIVVGSQEINSQAGESVHPIEIGEVAAGSYFLCIEQNGKKNYLLMNVVK